MPTYTEDNQSNIPLPAEAASSTAQASQASSAQTSQSNPLQLLSDLLKSNNIGTGNQPLTTRQTQVSPVQPLIPTAHPEMRMDDREFATGTGNARVARNNLFRNLTTLVNTASQQREAKQTRALQNDITRMFGAMEGLQQAQANGDKEAEAHNKQIITDILGDPKKAKQIEKAFDINLLGDQKNPKENAALMKAYSDWNKGGQKGENPVAAKATANFNRAMPQIQGMNPAIIARMQLEKMNKEGGGITDKDRLDTYGKIVSTQMISDAHKYVANLQYAGRIDEEVQRGINEQNKVLIQTMGKSDKESINNQQKVIKDTHDMLSKSITAKQKAIDSLGTTLPFTQAGRQKEQLQKELDGLKKLINQNESYQLFLQKRVTGGTDAGADGANSTGTGTGNTGDKKTSPSTTSGTKGRTGETLGLPSAIYDEFYQQFWNIWSGKSGSNDSYEGKQSQ